jgi:predicted amidohydrolase YtcJ
MDLVLLNGTVVTMANPNKREQAVALSDGRIVKVGSNSAVRAASPSRATVIDLAGKTVLPGFTDSHMHCMMTGFWLSCARLETACTVEEVCVRIHAKAKDTPAGEWVYGMGCMPWGLRENRFPTMTELDRVSEGHPVYVAAVTLHSGCANTAAFEFINPDANSQGLDRDPVTRKPTGAFLTDDVTFAACGKAFGALSDGEMADVIRKVAAYAASKGVTSLHCLDGQFVEGDRDVFVHLRIQDSLPIHTVIMFQTMDVQKVLELGLPRIGGCLTVDGAEFERTCLYYEPYTDDPTTCGRLNIPEDVIRSFVREAHQAGLQVGMHAIGDRAVDILVQAIADAMTETPRDDPRHRVEHFQWPSDWAIDKAVELGLALPMQPVFSWLWDIPGHSEYERVLGRERTDRLQPFPVLTKRGLVVSGGSDCPVTDVDPLLGVHALVNMPFEWRRVSVEEALRMFTLNGSWVASEERLRGSIEEGKLADLVVLGGDPYLESGHIADIPVEATIVGGEVVFGNL